MATINPRKILLDTLNSSKINANYNVEEKSSSPKSYGVSRLVRSGKTLNFNGVSCIGLQHHIGMFNNGPGALYPATDSSTIYVNSVTGNFEGSSIYQGNVLPTSKHIWEVATSQDLAPPTSFLEGSNYNKTSSYSLRNPVASLRQLFTDQSDPYSYGSEIARFTVKLTITSSTFRDQLYKYVPCLQYSYTQTIGTTSVTDSYYIDTRGIVPVLLGMETYAFVYDGTANLRLDLVRCLKTSNL